MIFHQINIWRILLCLNPIFKYGNIEIYKYLLEKCGMRALEYKEYEADKDGLKEEVIFNVEAI